MTKNRPRIRLSVATTRGPVRVLRLTGENPSVRSAVCIAGSFDALPISAAYDAFVRAPTGLIEAMTGHPVYRADVSAPIEGGDSWQLGFFLAHHFQEQGLLAEEDTAAELDVLVTGALNRDLTIEAVQHVSEKCARAGLPASGNGIFLFPAAGERPADMEGWRGVPAANVQDALREILGPQAAASGRQPKRLRVLSAIAAATVLAGVFHYVSGPRDLPKGAEGPVEERSNAAEAVSLEIEPRSASGGCGPPIAMPAEETVFFGRPCLGRVTIDGAGEYLVRMAVTGAFLSYTDPRRYRRELHQALDTGYRLVLGIDFPYWVQDPMQLDLEVVRLGPDGKSLAVSNRTLSVQPERTGEY